MRHDGVGMILSDWGDNGHLQPLITIYPALVVAAGAAWNVPEALAASDPEIELVGRLLDCHIFHDGDVGGVLGSVLCMFGDIHLSAESTEPELRDKTQDDSDRASCSKLFGLLVYRNDIPSSRGLNATGLRRAQRRVEKALDILHSYSGRASSIDQLELQLVGELLRIACRIGISLNSTQGSSGDGGSMALKQISGLTRSDVVNRFVQILYLYRICWDLRCRPRTFSKSVRFLERPLMELASELPYMPGFIEEKSQRGWKNPKPA